MTHFKTLKDIPNLEGQRVLLRVDLNVPLKDGKVADSTRIDRIRPTLDLLTQKGAKVIILTHLGRPKGKVDPSLSTKLLADYLKVNFSDAAPGADLAADIAKLSNGEILLLENVRFFPGEEDNDPKLAEAFAQMADLYINDAFSVSHRAHMSVVAITKYLPSYAGPTLEKELEALTQALESPERPLLAIVGGAKVSSKLEILENLSKKVDTLVIGGAMANTFLLARGHDVGASLVEPMLTSKALDILSSAPCRIILPEDVVVAPDATSSAAITIKGLGKIGPEEKILDIGPETIATIESRLEQAKTVIINGPLGVFEHPPFDKGTNEVFKEVATLTQNKEIISIAGGGDTIAALAHADVQGKLSYVSTAGGAFLEWLEGKDLPGVESLVVGS